MVKEKETPQLIFESLNSTGLDLTQVDFIRDYLTLKTGKIPNKDYVYNSFKDYYQSLDNYEGMENECSYRLKPLRQLWSR